MTPSPLPSRALTVFALGMLLCGCPKNTEPPDGGSCEGQPGCACLTGNTCQAGECLAGTCVDCRRGDLACVCRSNGTCNAGLRCAAQRCETCPPGQDGCACDAQGLCGAGLQCTAGTCTPASCTAGTRDCPCRSSNPACDGTDTCDTSAVCRACGPDVVGCPCGSGNSCQGGLVCDGASTRCRAPVTCAALLLAGTCAPHQVCNAAAGADAVCVATTCEAGFKWDTRTSTCAACVTPQCAAEPSCAAGDAGDACEQQNRRCEGGNTPYCSTCKSGFAENAMMACVPAPTCGTATCLLSQYCNAASGTPVCADLPCPLGQAITTGGVCKACGLGCSGTGYTGRVWPFAANNGDCLCETLPDYFVRVGGSGFAAPCDADGDGWVNSVADNVSDPQYRANARCTVRKADTVRLVDEFGVGLSLRSCDVTGMVPQPQAGGPCATVVPLSLLESPRNDVPWSATAATRAPVYGASGGADGGVSGGTGRYLEARELNALTKACVSTTADYNDNLVDDLGEVAPLAPVDVASAATRLSAFAYFVELYESYYEPPALGAPYGTLVIKERSRCGNDFPLHYDPAVDPLAPVPADAYRADDAGVTYWRNCGRRRDPAFNAMLPNFDFAQWSCAGATGGCAYVPPPHRTSVAPLNPATGLLRSFGGCELNGSLPADGLWRGMGHHSQFKCVNVIPSGPGANGYDVPVSDVAPSGNLVLSTCAARPCASEMDPTCQKAQGTGAQTSRPVIDCRAQTTGIAGAVGFAALKYRPYGPVAAGYPSGSSYVGGCVNEEVENQPLPPTSPLYLTTLCPYPEYSSIFSPVAATAAAQRVDSDRAFGRYSCFPDAPNFLWGPGLSDGGTQRANLIWGSGALR